MNTVSIPRQKLTRRNIVVFYKNYNRGVYKECPIGKAFLTMFFDIHERDCPLYYIEDVNECWNDIMDTYNNLPRYATCAEALGMSMKSG